MTLTDQSPMPFGKHRGAKMEDVPASYLCWLYGQPRHGHCDVREYIRENLVALAKEHPDGIWEESGVR